MSGNKTVANDSSVEAFIESVPDAGRRADSREMIGRMKRITGQEPRMWGNSLVGFGRYRYRYESGREGEFFLTGFSPRKTAFTIYIMPGLARYAHLCAKLGPHKTGKSCLYVRRLEAIDPDVLEEIIRDSVDYMREKHRG